MPTQIAPPTSPTQVACVEGVGCTYFVQLDTEPGPDRYVVVCDPSAPAGVPPAFEFEATTLLAALIWVAGTVTEELTAEMAF